MTVPVSRSRLVTTGTAALIALIFLMSIGAAPAAAQFSDEEKEGSPTDFLCKKYDSYGNVVYQGEPGYAEAEYEPIVYLLQNVVGVFMVVGPAGGVIVGLYATVAGVLQPGGDGDRGKYTKMRRNSLLLGFGVPISAYAFKLLGEAILPYNTGCIIPEIPF